MVLLADGVRKVIYAAACLVLALQTERSKTTPPRSHTSTYNYPPFFPKKKYRHTKKRRAGWVSQRLASRVSTGQESAMV